MQKRGGKCTLRAGLLGKIKGRANNRLHATWLIGALFEFFHPHWSLLLGGGAHAVPAKRVNRTVGLLGSGKVLFYPSALACYAAEFFVYRTGIASSFVKLVGFGWRVVFPQRGLCGASGSGKRVALSTAF